MLKKFAVVDEDLPRIIDAILERLGWKVLDVRNVGPRGRNDLEIISFAHKSKAVLFPAEKALWHCYFELSQRTFHNCHRRGNREGTLETR